MIIKENCRYKLKNGMVVGPLVYLYLENRYASSTVLSHFRWNKEGKYSPLVGYMDWVDYDIVEEVDYGEDIYCNCCHREFWAESYPSVGDSVQCPNCKADGYGTYNSSGYYTLEWY